MNCYIDERTDGIYVRQDGYVLWLPAARPYALVADGDGRPWAELFLVSSVHVVGGLDDTYRIDPAEVERTADGVRLTIVSYGTVWRSKRTVLECEPDALHLTVTVEGAGRLTDVHLLGGSYAGDIDLASGYHQSGASFRSVCNPEPWGPERRALHARESTILDVLGSSVPGKEHWLFTPPPLALPLSREAPPAEPDALPAGPWSTLAVGAAPGELDVTALHYDAVDGAFSLRLTYEGQTQVEGSFTCPTVSWHVGAADPYEGIAAHRRWLERRGWVPDVADRPRAAWWSEPIFCGWGSQCVLANQRGGTPQDHATAATYDGFLAALAAQDLHPGTVVIDDKWQLAYGSWEADTTKWPDLRRWIDGRHDAGQRVLLWWKAWDPEGLPSEWCVRTPDGRPMGVDPTHPGYEASLRESVRHMLGGHGYDADGFKIDFSARTPSGPSLERHGGAWGIELLHRLLWIVYDEAKATKSDALVMTHTPHPSFVDVTDMVRLNDVNTRAGVVAQMTHRARVARAACPELLVDTDNWPIPDPESFRDYLEVQAELGVPSLYFATHLERHAPWTKSYGHVGWDGYRAARAEDGAPIDDSRGALVPMTDDDYAAIRRVWRRARQRSDLDG